jgi:integrase
MPKRAEPLNAKQIDAARKRSSNVELIDGNVPGLRVRVGEGGNLLWSLYIYNAEGKRRRYKIVGDGLGLAEARECGRKLKREIAGGKDPTKERRQARQRTKHAQEGIGTLGTLIDHYYDHGDGRVKVSKDNQRQLLRHVFARHLDRPAVDIAVSDIQLAAEAHASPSSAARAVAYLKPLAKWAARRGSMQKGFEELAKPIDPNSRAGRLPAIDIESLGKIWSGLEGPHGRAARLMLWTGCRRSEATGAMWREFDLDAALWTVSADRRKDTRGHGQKAHRATQAHVIPLARQAVAMLREIYTDKISSDALLFPTETGGELGNWDRWGKQFAARVGTGTWSRHDLRRTCATIAGDLGVEPHIISIVLGHKNPGGNQLLGIYNKSRYRSEHAKALQRVADFLELLESRTSVVPLRRPA